MKHTVSELIELALIYAIQDREGMACAAANDPEGPKAAVLAKEFEALLLRRYGKITRQEKERRDLASGRARMVNIEDLP